MGKPVVGLWKYSGQSRIFKEVLQVPLYMRIEYETGGGIRFRKMRIRFGIILSILMRQRINENMVRTDSQDYGADEIG